MEINKKEFYELLKSIGVSHLHHVNTEQTSMAFINHGGLLSRGWMEDNQLPMTWQYSDEKDKEFDVWHDIFLDDVDIHERSGKENHYGNVMFVYDLEVLLEPGVKLYITKSNPADWQNDKDYFVSIEELKEDYNKGTFKQMITLKKYTNPLPFSPYLKEIVVDKGTSEEFKNVLKEKGLDYKERYCLCC